MVGKGEFAQPEQFLRLPQLFLELSLTNLYNLIIVWVKVWI